eukprot:scaffold3854_cov107-Isochrysis_galbana.AAC.14
MPPAAALALSAKSKRKARRRHARDERTERAAKSERGQHATCTCDAEKHKRAQRDPAHLPCCALHAAEPAGVSLHALNPAAPGATPSCASERRIAPSSPLAAARARAASKVATRAANSWWSRCADLGFGAPVRARQMEACWVKPRMGTTWALDGELGLSPSTNAPRPTSRETSSPLPRHASSPAVATCHVGLCTGSVGRNGAPFFPAGDRKSRAIAPNLAASASYDCS